MRFAVNPHNAHASTGTPRDPIGARGILAIVHIATQRAEFRSSVQAGTPIAGHCRADPAMTCDGRATFPSKEEKSLQIVAECHARTHAPQLDAILQCIPHPWTTSARDVTGKIGGHGHRGHHERARSARGVQ
jgi:hypothetical protein